MILDNFKIAVIVIMITTGSLNTLSTIYLMKIKNFKISSMLAKDSTLTNIIITHMSKYLHYNTDFFNVFWVSFSTSPLFYHKVLE